MIKYLRYSLFLSLLIFFMGVGNTAFGRKIPKWVRNRPVKKEFYIGIGMAKNTGTDQNYMQVAKSNALNDLCSEISVMVSSNSVLHQFENNYEFKEEFEAKTRTSLRQNLEGYELVASWYNKREKEYWVYYQLSRQKYELLKRIKLNKAKKLAETFFQQAKQNEQKLDLFQALNYYAKALDAIKDHLDEDLSVMTLDGKINLGCDIYNSIQNVFQRIQLQPKNKSIRIDISTAPKDPLLIEATWLGNEGEQAISQLPLQFHFSKGDGILNSEVKTDSEGIATSNLSKVTSKQKLQEIEVSLNLSSILGENCENKKLNSLFFTPESVPSCKILLNVERLTAFMDFEEKIFGNTSQRSILKNNFKKELSENFFSFTNQKGDAKVLLNIRTNVTKGEIKEGRNYKVYIVYLDCFISLTDAKSGMEIFNDALYEIKGMKPISYEYAVKEAYEEVINEIHNNIIPKLNQLDL
ncbi:MAG: LPP20 family lipoprotein [Marinifilaceae bacterium]